MEIIEYYQGKVTHQHKPLPTTAKPAAELSIPKEQFLQNMFTYFKNAVYNSKPAQDYIKSRGLDLVRLEIGYNTAQFHHGTRPDETLISNCVAVGLLSPWGNNTRKPDEQAYKAFGKECIVFAFCPCESSSEADNARSYDRYSWVEIKVIGNKAAAA